MFSTDYDSFDDESDKRCREERDSMLRYQYSFEEPYRTYRERNFKMLIVSQLTKTVFSRMTMFMSIKPVEIVKLLIEESSINNYNEVIIEASLYGDFEIVKLLLENGAIHDEEAMGFACEYGHVEIVKLLLENGADIDGALLCSSFNGRFETVKFLIKYGVDIHEEDEKALRYASSNLIFEGKEENEEMRVESLYASFKTVKVLIENGANIHAKDNEALINASRDGNFKTVKFLIENGANIYARNNEALINASRNGNFKTVKFLIENGANIYARNNGSINIAFVNRHSENSGFSKMIKLLYWKYSLSERDSIENNFPELKVFWESIKNCELLYKKLPYEIIQLIKREVFIVPEECICRFCEREYL
jgi:ankyrin repeat protein